MFHRVFLIAVSIGLCVGCGTVHVGPGTAVKGRLRVGTSGDYAPFSSLSEQGRFEGFEIELARRFAREHGLALDFVPFRWPNLVADLASNRFDVAMSGVTVRPERSLAGRFTIPIAISGAVAIVPSNSVAKFAVDLNRANTRIGVNRGGHLERVARAHFTSATIVTSPDNNRLPELLLRGECDAIISDTVESPHWVARVPGARVLGPFTRDYKAWLLRKENGDLAGLLDYWLVAREADGTLRRARRHYFGGTDHERSAEPLAALLASVDERLALMPLVAQTKRVTGRPVEDVAQEERVLEAAARQVRETARARGWRAADETAVRAFFRAQIEAGKAIQRRVLDAPDMGYGGSQLDLDSQVRPALARIGERSALLIGELQARSHGRARGAKSIVEAAVDVLQKHALPPADLAALAHTLVALTEDSASTRNAIAK